MHVAEAAPNNGHSANYLTITHNIMHTTHSRFIYNGTIDILNDNVIYSYNSEYSYSNKYSDSSVSHVASNLATSIST